MTAQTLTLADFLAARFDEDEAAALGAVGYESRAYWEDAVARRSLRPESVAHYERHDPDRVLAEVAAKRRIVALHQPSDAREHGYSNEGRCAVCVEFHADVGCEQEDWPCPTLRALALPYTSHPDFRWPKWRA